MTLVVMFPAAPENQTSLRGTPTNCTMGSPINSVPNQTANQCAWAGVEVQGLGWLNATVTATADGAWAAVR